MFSCADGSFEVSTRRVREPWAPLEARWFVAHREVIDHETFHADASLVQHIDDVLLDHQLKVERVDSHRAVVRGGRRSAPKTGGVRAHASDATCGFCRSSSTVTTLEGSIVKTRQKAVEMFDA